MAHLNQSQTDADEIQKMISQYFPQPELLANHPPGTQGYWQQQRQWQQQQQQQQSTSHPGLQAPLPQQSLYHPSPRHAAQPWTEHESATTSESRMPAPYPHISEQHSFQDLMRLIQNERVAAALPSSSSLSYSDSEPGVNYR